MDANDEIRKAFEQEFNLYQEYIDKRKENDKSLKDLDKERKEYEQSWSEYDNEDDFGGMCAMGRAIDIVRSGGKEQGWRD